MILPLFRSNKPVLQRPIEPGEFTASLVALARGGLGVTQSMARVGSCSDNAASRSCWPCLRGELVHLQCPPMGSKCLCPWTLHAIRFGAPGSV